MARIRKSTLSFDAITLEGSLISPAKFAEIAERKATEQTDADYAIPKGLNLRDEAARGQASRRDRGDLPSGTLPGKELPARPRAIELERARTLITAARIRT